MTNSFSHFSDEELLQYLQSNHISVLSQNGLLHDLHEELFIRVENLKEILRKLGVKPDVFKQPKDQIFKSNIYWLFTFDNLLQSIEGRNQA